MSGVSGEGHGPFGKIGAVRIVGCRPVSSDSGAVSCCIPVPLVVFFTSFVISQNRADFPKKRMWVTAKITDRELREKCLG